ncbi:MAG: trypsin-like peptidase domain-containing protein [Actinobacteria bacterium]|nr:trypsin-like peptidase domain-containing protein [Actinomycetota bacterium]
MGQRRFGLGIASNRYEPKSGKGKKVLVGGRDAVDSLEDFDYPDEPERPRRPDLSVVNHTNPRKGGRRFVAGVIALSLVSAIVGGLAGGLTLPYLFGNNPLNVYRSSSGTKDSQYIKIDGRTPVSPVTAVAQKLQPSIVNIRTRQGGGQSAPHSDANGVGSGVILRSDGYVITNLHVIEGASDIWVTVGTDDIRGSVVGTDQESDLAVVKVARENLTAAEFGSTKALKVGDIVVAMGSPFGFEHTVTSGIVSGLHRTVNLPEKGSSAPRAYTNMIQTDAPINPGNSGGALADWRGRVIGINALIMSNSGVNEGVGFAIPAETALSVAEQLIKKGKASHPFMGILGQNTDPGLAKEYALAPEQKGALVVDVVAGSPASRAGLQKGDIIISINGKRVNSMDELMTEVRQYRVGEKLSIEYLRKEKRGSSEITLIDKPKE